MVYLHSIKVTVTACMPGYLTTLSSYHIATYFTFLAILQQGA